MVGRKFTVFALFYFVFEDNFQVQAPGGLGLYLEGRFNGGFFCFTSLGGLYLEGRIHGGAYFSEFYGMQDVGFLLNHKIIPFHKVRFECFYFQPRGLFRGLGIPCPTKIKSVTGVYPVIPLS